MDTLFVQIGVVIAVATAFALLARFFKQPPLLGYIAAGLALGPIGFKAVDNHELFKGGEQIAIALLLFLIGLEIDWKKARHQLGTTFVLGIAQMVGSFLGGYLFGSLLGLDPLTSLYIGLALCFSSTILVVKVLSESRDLNSLHGRLTVGILLFHDIAAVVTLVVVKGLGTPSSLPFAELLFFLIIKAASLLALLYCIAQYMLPPLFAKIAKSSELLFLSSLAWCFVVAISAARFDFPLELGAFLAGISLGSLPYGLDILNRLRSVRDFFVVLLFVGLGSALVIPSGTYLTLTLGLVLLTVLLKPLIAFLVLHRRSYKNRTSFLTAASLGQLSEFSLILLEIGRSGGRISSEIASSLTVAAVVSLFLSAFVLTNREKLYRALRKPLHWLEPLSPRSVPVLEPNAHQNHIIIFGYHRMGYHILKQLRDNHDVLVVDFNPEIIKKLRAQDIECIYGDVQDEDILEQISAENASMIISTVPHREETLFLIEQVKAKKHAPLLIVTSHTVDDALDYYKMGADYVILPHMLGGEHVAELITHYEQKSLRSFIGKRAEEVRLLKTRNHALYYD